MNGVAYPSREPLGFMPITANRLMSAFLRRAMKEVGISLASEQLPREMLQPERPAGSAGRTHCNEVRHERHANDQREDGAAAGAFGP